MHPVPVRFFSLRMCGLAAVCAALPACAPTYHSYRIPAAPIVFRWPDPAFLPERQCRGRYYSAEEVESYVSQARLVLQLPSTHAVVLTPERRCITMVVNSVGGGRLAELALRGVAVPRRAVVLRLEGTERSGRRGGRGYRRSP